MAFNQQNGSVSNVSKGAFEQALGFLNIGLPNSQGEMSKFGALTLKESNAAEKGMFDDLNGASAEVQAQILDWVKANLVLTFRANTSGAKAITFGYKKAA